MSDALSLMSAAALIQLSNSPSPKRGPLQFTSRATVAATTASRLLMGLSSPGRSITPLPTPPTPTPSTLARPSTITRAPVASTGSLDATCRRVVDQLALHMGTAAFSAAELADNLQQSRRRVYDILHVLEAIGVVSRNPSKKYIHHGVDAVPTTLAGIRSEVMAARQQARQRTSSPTAARGLAEELLMSSADPTVMRKQRLLHVTRQFLQLCMLDGQNPAVAEISLKEAGARIRVDSASATAGEQAAAATGKTNRSGVGRRLYDVVSVLVSVGLVSAHKMKKEKSVVVNPALFDPAARGRDFTAFRRSAPASSPPSGPKASSDPVQQEPAKRRRSGSSSDRGSKSPRTPEREHPGVTAAVPDLELSAPVPMAVDNMGALGGLMPSPPPPPRGSSNSPVLAATDVMAKGWSSPVPTEDVDMTFTGA